MSVNGQEFELSLAHKIVAAPVDTIWFEGQTAEGQFRATMELFKAELKIATRMPRLSRKKHFFGAK